MRASEAQRAGVLAWIESWRPRLYLQHYRIEPIWRTKAHREDSDERETRARATMDDAGLVAHIELFPSFWRITPEMQARTIVHELGHVVLPNATEHEVNVFTEIVWRAYEVPSCPNLPTGLTL